MLRWGSGSVRDERDERLERAGYLLIVSIDRLVRAIAAFGWPIVRFLTRRRVTAEGRSVRTDETRASQRATEQSG